MATVWRALLLGALLAGGARSQDPVETASLRNDLAVNYARDGSYEDGLRQLSLVLAEFPDNIAALNNTANIYSLLGDIETAAGLYQRALAADSSQGLVHLNYGIILYATGKEESGVDHVRSGLLLLGEIPQLGFGGSPGSEPSTRADGPSPSADVERLLARALARIRAEAETPTNAPPDTSLQMARGTASTPSTERTDANFKILDARAGGAKGSASPARVGADQLFWMSISEER